MDINSLQYYYDIIIDLISLHEKQKYEFDFLNKISTTQFNNKTTINLRRRKINKNLGLVQCRQLKKTMKTTVL